MDTVLHQDDADFAQTGLKLPSVIRVTRLAIVASSMLQGAIGSMPALRLSRIRRSITDWMSGVRFASVPSDTEQAEYQPGDA